MTIIDRTWESGLESKKSFCQQAKEHGANFVAMMTHTDGRGFRILSSTFYIVFDDRDDLFAQLNARNLEDVSLGVQIVDLRGAVSVDRAFDNMDQNETLCHELQNYIAVDRDIRSANQESQKFSYRLNSIFRTQANETDAMIALSQKYSQHANPTLAIATEKGLIKTL